MKLKPKITIADHFGTINDPRIERSKQHKLIDMSHDTFARLFARLNSRAEPETLRLRSVRTVDGKTTVETGYYISSLSNNAEIFGQSVRSHWGVENSLHWGGVSAGEASLSIIPK